MGVNLCSHHIIQPITWVSWHFVVIGMRSCRRREQEPNTDIQDVAQKPQCTEVGQFLGQETCSIFHSKQRTTLSWHSSQPTFSRSKISRIEREYNLARSLAGKGGTANLRSWGQKPYLPSSSKLAVVEHHRKPSSRPWDVQLLYSVPMNRKGNLQNWPSSLPNFTFTTVEKNDNVNLFALHPKQG